MEKLKEPSLRSMQRKLWMLGCFKIPLLAFCRPKLISLDEEKVELKIKLKRRTKNHLNSMYFGALSVGADVSGGILAFYFAEVYGIKISFAFKSFKADFHKRAESDVIFVCKQGELIRNTVEKAMISGERKNEVVRIEAWDNLGTNVSSFDLELSVKVK